MSRSNRNMMYRSAVNRWIRVMLLLSNGKAYLTREIHHALKAMGDDVSKGTCAKALNNMARAGWIRKDNDPPKQIGGRTYQYNRWGLSDGATRMREDGVLATQEEFEDYTNNEDALDAMMKSLQNSAVGVSGDPYVSEHD